MHVKKHRLLYVSLFSIAQLEFPNKIIKIRTKYIASLIIIPYVRCRSDQEKVDYVLQLTASIVEFGSVSLCFGLFVKLYVRKKLVSRIFKYRPIKISLSYNKCPLYGKLTAYIYWLKSLVDRLR